MRPVRARSGQVGLAMSADMATLVPLGGSPSPQRVTHARLAEELIRVRDAGGWAQGILHVALLPPLVQSRRLTFPRLRHDELQRIISRDASRYFLPTSEALLIEATAPAPWARSPVVVTAAAAPAAVVELVYEAAEQAGFHVATMVDARAAWTRHASKAWSRPRSEPDLVVAALPGSTEVLLLRRGRCVLLRRLLPLKSRDQAADGIRRLLLAHDMARPATAVYAPGSEREWLGSALSEAGCQVLCPPSTAEELEPDIVAAQYAARAQGQRFAPAEVISARKARSVRLARQVWAAAVAMLVVSASLWIWAKQQRLRTLHARRAALAVSVREALKTRDAVTGLERRIAALTAAEATSPHWSETLAGLAEAVPREAYLLELRGGADSVVLVGEGRNAASVFESVRRTSNVVAIRADAPIRQETRSDGSPVERFVLVARFAHGDQEPERVP
jgi:hypothetical protein